MSDWLFPDLYHAKVQPFPTAPYATGSATSKAGADAVQGSLQRRCAELLNVYLEHGPLTDLEAAHYLGWERTSVIPRRHQLVRRGQVQKCGTRKNPRSGVENDVYGLKYGWAAKA